MNIKQVPIDQVQLWDKNPRNIKTRDFERLKRHITELGIYKPLIAYQENGGGYTVLGGNMRLRALQEMGIKEVEISVVKAETEAQKIKFALSDNDRAGEYDEQALAELVYPHIEEIQLEDYKIDVGEPINLKQVIESYGPDMDEEDDVPEIDDSPAITKLGDLFTLGKHRLLCGDATKEEDVKRLMDGEKVYAVVTDPPYNVGKEFENDSLSKKSFYEFCRSFIALLPCEGIVVAFQSPQTFPILLDATRENGWEFGRMLWLFKPGTAFGVVPWHGWARRSECILVLIKNPAWPDWVDYSPDMYEHKKGEGATEDSFFDKDNPIHPTLKPLWVVRDLVNHTTGDVLDPFLGSGTTLIACEKLNRICYGMEIEPKYVDVVITRYANFTGTSEEEIRAMVEHGN